MEKINRVSLRLLEGKKDLIGVEIGVNEGVNAKNILENLDIKKLYLVDPYIAYEHYPQEKVDNWKRKGYSALAEFKDKIEWVEKKSIDAAEDIPNNLDFVYVDGDHTYFSVLSDLKTYVDKIKKGGLLCGDNFEHQDTRLAVYDFMVFYGEKIKIPVAFGENKTTPTCDWWVFI